jgi:glycosyltransferase involved in cell wall biosynthesis
VSAAARVTVAVPSYNQGRYLEQALESIFAQEVPVEVFVVDADSTDNTKDVIERWKPRLAGWRSHKDGGQAAAINEGIARGSAPYVAWLNSDDWLEKGAYARLISALEANATAPMAYGRAWNVDERTGRKTPVFVRPFSERWMAQINLIPQPAALVRRASWQVVDGVDESLQMAMDYDLWWKLYRKLGPPAFVDEFLATNREHASTKTGTRRKQHYKEAIAVVRKHYGRVPLKWWLAQPYAVWYRSLMRR